MPEIIEDDRIASLFAQFRTEAGAEILPPGTLAAQQTVRRRRTSRLAATVALAVVGLAGAALGIVTVSDGTGTHVEPADSHSFGPTLAPDELDRLGAEALAQLGYKPTNDRTRPELQLVRPGIMFGGMRAEAAAFTYGFGTADEPFPQGEYNLMAVCLGRGKVSVGWSTPEGASGSVDLDCGVDDRSRFVAFTSPVRGILTLTVTPDEEAIGRAGIAAAVTDPRIVLARNVLGEEGQEFVSGGGGIVSTPTGNVLQSASDVADYRLSVACIGAGSVDVTFAIGSATASQSLPCTKAGATTSLTVTSPTAGAYMSVSIDPDAAAMDQAAVAYRVTKV